jgi:hypothetical protein
MVFNALARILCVGNACFGDLDEEDYPIELHSDSRCNEPNHVLNVEKPSPTYTWRPGISMVREYDSQRIAISLDRDSEKSSSQAPSLPEMVMGEFDLSISRVASEVEKRVVSVIHAVPNNVVSPPSTGTVSDLTASTKQRACFEQSNQNIPQTEFSVYKDELEDIIRIVSTELQPESVRRPEYPIDPTATVHLLSQPLD